MQEVAVLAAWLNLQSELFSQNVITKESLKSIRESLFRREGGGGEFLRNLLLHNVLAASGSLYNNVLFVVCLFFLVLLW